jgi:hypothetical protein
MATSYSEKLKDPRWQRKRLEIMQRDEFRCVQCKDAESTLNVHHVYYRRGRDPWDYPNYLLVTLCEDCHSKTPMAVNALTEAVSSVNPTILIAFAYELGVFEYPAGVIRLLTAILQSPEQFSEMQGWFDTLPLDRQMGIRPEEK